MTLRMRFAPFAFIAIGVAFPASFSCAGAVDPSDLTQSSYAAPVRGDVIEWKTPSVVQSDAMAFDEGSAVLPATTRVALVAAVARLGPRGHAEVVGRADPAGKPALGVARAFALKRALMMAGLPADRIAIVSERNAEAFPDAPSQSGQSVVRWIPPARGGVPRSAERFVPVASSAPAFASVAAAMITATTPAGEPAPVAAPAPQIWEVQTQDITLARTLERWAAAAGYRLRWDADRNFLIAASDRYEGTFEAALGAVLGSAGIRQSDYPLEACVYANRPPLVRITRLGEQARECEGP